MRRLLLLVFSAGLAAVSSLFVFAFVSLKSPVVHEPATLTIQRGTPMAMIAEQLSRAGVIRNPLLFTAFARAFHYDRKIKAGEYDFPSGLSALDIIMKMVKGECKLYKITLIEGWTYRQMADYLAAQPFAGENFRDDFIAAAEDRYLVNSLGAPNDTAEGYLFPNTYMVQRPKAAEWLISMLISEFNRVYTPEFELRAKELGLTKNQVVTLASIIEKETGLEAERTIVSSVYHNRLKLRMPLQADPTVIYAIQGYDGNIKKSDLSNPSPYNTYVHPGLPPGPIANPGLASIKAALWPADTDYLYFVAKGDGSHQFSAKYSDHSKAVSRYQLRK